MLSDLINYMNRQDVHAALHVDPNVNYIQCSNLLWKKFLVEFQESYIQMLPPLLQNTTYRVLVYNGQVRKSNF